MPTDDDGTYHSIDPTTRQLMGDYIANLIRNGAAHDRDLSTAVFNRFSAGGKLDGTDYLAYQSLLRQEQRAIDIANTLNANPNAPGGTLPTIPGDIGYSGQFVYDTLIHATDPLTGEQFTHRVQVFSPLQLSAGQVAEEIDSRRDEFLGEGGSPQPKSGQIQRVTFEITILGAGRVGTPF